MGSIKQSAMFSALSKLSGLVRPLNSLRFARNQSTLVLVEHNNEKVNPVTLNAITAARALGGEVNCLVAGTSCGGVAKEVSSVEGISKVLVAEDAAFEGFMPEKLTPLLMASQNQFKFTPISDIIGIKDSDTFIRTIYAGNAIMTLKSMDPVKIVTVRTTAFEAATVGGGSGAVEAAPAAADDVAAVSQFVGQELSKSDRPDLGSAKVVVSGGRGMKTGDNFSMLYDLADKLGA